MHVIVLAIARWVAGPSACALIVLLAGCDDVPRDPGGSLGRIRHAHTLDVGVLNEPPWAECSGDGEQVRGIEVQAITRFAEHLDASPAWHCLSEAQAFAALKKQGLDLVIGGLTADNPRKKESAFTRPYFEAGKTDTFRHVMAVQRGENRFMVTLERFLAREATAIEADVAEIAE